MEKNISLSTQQVADILHVSKSTIYDLIRRGEINSYKIGRKVRFTQDDVDAYVARSRHEQSTKPVVRVDVGSTFLSQAEGESFIISGQDAILDILSSHMRQSGVNAARSYLSGFEGLLSLYQGNVDVASCHLYSGHDRSYNIPYIRALVPGVSTVVINLTYRLQGFYVKKGNPKKIRSWPDILRDDVTIINRREGSASRILLDEKIKAMKSDPSKVSGYGNIMNSHLTMAAAIESGEADVGLGTERISGRSDGLEFVPLMRERYDLVLRKSIMDSVEVETLLNVLYSDGFRKEISTISGNDYSDMGKIIAEV